MRKLLRAKELRPVRCPRVLSACLTAAFGIAFGSAGQAVTLYGDFAGYTLTNFGGIGLNPVFGDFTGGFYIDAGNPNVAYVSGAANYPGAALYTIPLNRDSVTNRITSITPYSESNPATAKFLDTPFVDGSVLLSFSGGYATSNLTNVVYTTFDADIYDEFVDGNTIVQLLPDGIGGFNTYTTPVEDLFTPPPTVGGVDGSTGGLVLAQGGMPAIQSSSRTTGPATSTA